jgi:DNA-binding MarR family transcriptional regulator
VASPGVDLALLLLGGYRGLVDEVSAELERRGHPDFRASHEYALRTVAFGATNVSEVGRRLGISKQAAAKTVALLIDRGYLSRAKDPADARSMRLEVTPRGHEVSQLGQRHFDKLRKQWARRVGPEAFDVFERCLAELAGDTAVVPESPGWAAQALG